ncbi:MAG: hypothetical protein L3J12_06845 [Spirochaetales bacterium]|nr:hypothetical protein [Spirochaetales bacterium]
MKKIILILTVLAVLLFSGCDDMLEVFYPEFADNFNGTNNIIAVEYYYNATDMLANGYNTLEPLKIEIYKSGETPSNSTPFDYIEVWGEYSYYYEFFVPQGDYDVWIWQDSDVTPNGYDSGDFILNDNINGITPTYSFVGGDEYWYYYGWEWTQVP